MLHDHAQELLDLTQARLRAPLHGSGIERLVGFLDKYRGRSPSDESLADQVEMGTWLIRTDGHAFDRISKALLEAAAGITPKDIPVLDAQRRHEVANLAKEIARNTHKHEHRDRGRPTARAVIPLFHGARCVALAVHKFGMVPSDFGIDGPGEELLLATARLVLLQDGDDPEVQRLVRLEAARVVARRIAKGTTRDDLAEDLWAAYLASPPDYFTVPGTADAEYAKAVFISALGGKLDHLLEEPDRRAPEAPSPRTLRYRRQKGIQPDDLPSPGEFTRSSLANEIGISPTALVRLEKQGLLHPERKGKTVVYSTSERRKVFQIFRERGYFQDDDEE